MSETNTQATTADPQPNAPSVDPPAPQPQPAPEPAPTPEPEPEPTEEQKAETRNRGDRRFAELSAKYSNEARERARLAAEVEHLRQLTARLPPQPPTPEQEMQRLRAEVRAEVEQDLIVRRFHDEGRAAHQDWDQKCAHLMNIGADPGLARLLVETPGGVQLAAALADDPAEVQRIAGLQTAGARAVALGRYAATLEAVNGTPRPVAPVTKAPAPIRPVSGRANPVFNEYNASAQELADFYFKQNLERQQKR